MESPVDAGATTVTTVTVTEHLRIPMPDGVYLAARMWRPAGAGPFPALLEIIPYRKGDLTRARDERNHPFFAAHGFASVRVDMRGSGDSEGCMPDMYTVHELTDTRHVIAYLAAQDWCAGRVGMFGTSWGGTAALQAALDAPAALRAVIANCATADRFEDDIHWQGGEMLTDGFEWGATLPAILAAPPNAATVGDDWRRLWRSRLAQLAFPLAHWIRRRARGAYWRHGSVRFDAARLGCPILAIGGWSDRYSNSVMQLVQSRPDICRGIVGPWGHHYPDHGAPGPALGFQQLALAWWTHWLTDDTGATSKLNWPRLRLWRREFDPPQDKLDARRGDWIALDDLHATRTTVFYPVGDGLAAQPGDDFVAEVPHDLRHGACAGDTGYFGRDGGLALEQSADDARALCFDSAPLPHDIDLIGGAEFVCDIIREQARAQLAVRLCEVAADGRSLLVTRQVRNLALDDELESPAPFTAGAPVRVCVKLPAAAYRFRRGNRIRLAIGASYWPLVWPAPGPVRSAANMRLSTPNALLRLPRPARIAESPAPLPQAMDLPARKAWTVESEGELQRAQSTTGARMQSSWRLPRTTYRYTDTGVSISTATAAKYAADLKTAATKYSIAHAIAITRPDGRATINSALTAQSKTAKLTVDAKLTVQWNDENMADKTWRHVERL